MTDTESFQDDFYYQENAGSVAEAISRLELEISFGSEKLLNLEMLVMEVASRANDIEPLKLEPDSISSESVQKALELDILYGIFYSEAEELDKLVCAIQIDIENLENEVIEEEEEEESADRLMGKLEAATASLKQMQGLIAAVRRESKNFEMLLDPSHDKTGTSEGGAYENGHVLSHTSMHAEHQRSVLQMLDKSIASELDIEKKLCDSRSLVEELEIKLHHVENECYFLEESVEAISEKMFAAENASEVFLGTSKELIYKINTTLPYLCASSCKEGDLKSKQDQSLVKLNASKGIEKNAAQEAIEGQTVSTPEFFALRDMVQKLEEWLGKSRSQLQLKAVSARANTDQYMSHSEINTFGSIINDLKGAISKAENRTQNAEIRCAQLTRTNAQLDGDLSSLKCQGSDRAGLMEKRLKESDTQLEYAKAAMEAISEEHNMLVSSISDMEQTIEDLNGKCAKAETRAENAELKCTLLTDTNLELGEELSFLRGRMVSLENSLRQANQLKMPTAKDIGAKTKTITDLVAKLALERERLHVQILTLTKKNRILAQKCRAHGNEGVEELVPASSATQTRKYILTSFLVMVAVGLAHLLHQ